MYAGYVAPGDKFKDQPAIELQVISELVSSTPAVSNCAPGWVLDALFALCASHNSS
jgi:hypothetical protein